MAVVPGETGQVDADEGQRRHLVPVGQEVLEPQGNGDQRAPPRTDGLRTLYHRGGRVSHGRSFAGVFNAEGAESAENAELLVCLLSLIAYFTWPFSSARLGEWSRESD